MKYYDRKKALCLGLSMSMLLSACSGGKNFSEASQSPPSPAAPPPKDVSATSPAPAEKPTVPDSEVAAQVFARWKKLIEGPTPDLGLAQVLAGTVAEVAPQEANRWMKEIDGWETTNTDLAQKITQFKQDFTASYLQNRLKLTLSDRSVDSSVVANSIFATPDKDLFASDSMSLIVDLSLKSYLNNKAYQNLTQTYNQSLSQATTSVAQDVIFSLRSSRPLDFEKLLQLQRNALLDQKQIRAGVRDIISSDSRLSDCLAQIRSKLGNSGAEDIILEELSRQVLQSLSSGGTGTFIQQPLQQLAQEVSEIFVFKNALSEEKKKLRTDLRTLRSHSQALVGSVQNKRDRLKEVTTKISQEISVEKNEMDEAYAIVGETGFKSGEWQDFVSSAENAVSRIDGLCTASISLAQKLGIQVSPDVQNVVKTAAQVAQAVQIGSTIAAAFATGGASAILSAFSGVSALSGPDFSGMESELAEIKQQQQAILQNEVKIMEMIKDLADMVGQFHEEEMAQLYIIDQDIKDTSSIMTMMNWANCKKMLSALPATGAEDESSGLAWNQGFATYGRFSGLHGVQKYVSDTEPYYGLCMTTLGSTLSPVVQENGSDLKTSILRYTVSGEDKESQFLESIVYQPLLDFTKKNHRVYGVDIPAANMSILPTKYSMLAEPEYDKLLQLNYMLSPKRLQVYVLSYLNLRPLIQMDISQWRSAFVADGSEDGKESSTEQKLKRFLTSQEIGFAHTRSVSDLKAVLQLVQSAVGQESIIAGEPILDLLMQHYEDIFSSKENPLYKSVRANSILLTNLVTYSILHSIPPGMWADYEAARVQLDASKVIGLLGHRLGEPLRPYLKVDPSGHTLHIQLPATAGQGLGVAIDLPTAEDLGTGKMLYRSTMEALVQLQAKVMDELKDLSPIPLPPEEMKKLTAVLLIQAQTKKEQK